MTAPDDQGQEPAAGPPPLLTIRVSHDSGRTYGPTLAVHHGDDLPPLDTFQWPPCACPRHRTH
ncbi:hypothetical protein [Streptomyces sp. GSL17-111]|uniref:hypothetical protein n=1 Tax=Streptomyces sp. GSL17-111 TaxID=3121596 RepID=UPI0030F43BA0